MKQKMKRMKSNKKKTFLTSLLTLAVIEKIQYVSSASELLLFQLQYLFILSKSTNKESSFKRDFPTPRDISPQNPNGARYLDPKYSRWLSTDPALGEYMSGSDVGCGGIYNHVNLSLYHYGGNNPIKYVDPTGCDDLYYEFGDW